MQIHYLSPHWLVTTMSTFFFLPQHTNRNKFDNKADCVIILVIFFWPLHDATWGDRPYSREHSLRIMLRMILTTDQDTRQVFCASLCTSQGLRQWLLLWALYHRVGSGMRALDKQIPHIQQSSLCKSVLVGSYGIWTYSWEDEENKFNVGSVKIWVHVLLMSTGVQLNQKLHFRTFQILNLKQETERHGKPCFFAIRFRRTYLHKESSWQQARPSRTTWTLPQTAAASAPKYWWSDFAPDNWKSYDVQVLQQAEWDSSLDGMPINYYWMWPPSNLREATLVISCDSAFR